MKKFILSFLISTMIFAGGFYTVDKFFIKDDSYADNFIDNSLEEERTNLNSDGIVNTKKDKNELQFVLMGIDDGGLKEKRGVRTDTIILMSANFETGEIKGLTVPRDSRVNVNGKMDKINHAHSYGGKELAMKTINDYLGTDIDYYVRVDFKGVMEIVDAIGGVDMDVPVNMTYDDPTAKPPLKIRVKKGPQNLNGKMSHDVLRFRHNNGSGSYPGGYTREAVQQMWLKDFMKSAVKPKNIIKLPSMIETYFDSVDTNIPMKTIIACALKAGNLDVNSVRLETIPAKDEANPGYMINGAWYYIPNDVQSRIMATDMFND